MSVRADPISSNCNVPTGFVSLTDMFNYSNHQKSSSKAQIAACLLMIAVVAERGGIETSVGEWSVKGR
jgi:hypothetical protein